MYGFMRNLLTTYSYEEKGKIVVIGMKLTSGSNGIYQVKPRNIRKQEYTEFYL